MVKNRVVLATTNRRKKTPIKMERGAARMNREEPEIVAKKIYNNALNIPDIDLNHPVVSERNNSMKLQLPNILGR